MYVNMGYDVYGRWMLRGIVHWIRTVLMDIDCTGRLNTVCYENISLRWHVPNETPCLVHDVRTSTGLNPSSEDMFSIPLAIIHASM